MKKTISIILIVFISFICGCEKIDYPDEKNISTVDTTQYVRKVLLEDYTGHQCGNCPAAALVAEELTNKYKGKVITIAVHAGFFTKTNSKYPTSYTTTVGNDWDGSSGFGVSAVGNPNGMVNRKNYEGNGLIQKESKWPTTVSLALKDPYILGLEIKPTYDASARKVSTNIKAKFKVAYPNKVKVSLVLVEDSIIGPQTDYTKNPDLIPNYVFMHMLRDAVNGSWGTDLKDTPPLARDSMNLSFPNFAVKSQFNDTQLYLVAFAYDASTREVLQVEKVKMK